MSGKHSQALARRWSDPVYREKQIAVLKANNATRGRRKSHPMNEELAAYQKAVELAKEEIARLRSELVGERAARIRRESQLGQTRELLAWLSDAAWPAATILAHLALEEALDERVRETVQQTLAPLDAALAATKAGGE